MRFGYPVFLDVHDVPVLVVGAGRVGVRKVEGLVDAGAQVHVVAPEVHHSLDPATVAAVHERPYRASDLDAKRLVVTATGVTGVDAAVAGDATARGIWVNAADQTPHCSFILPAIARADDVTVAVSSDGTAPSISAWLRDRIVDEMLDDELRRLARVIAARRREVHGAGGSTEQLDWRAEIERLVERPGRGRADHGVTDTVTPRH